MLRSTSCFLVKNFRRRNIPQKQRTICFISCRKITRPKSKTECLCSWAAFYWYWAWLDLFPVSGSNMTWYLDLPSLLVLACICTALTLFSGKRTKREVIPFLRKIVLPVGICESLMAVGCVVGNVQDIPLLGANLAVCILSVLYALIAYLVLFVMEQRMW